MSKKEKKVNLKPNLTVQATGADKVFNICVNTFMIVLLIIIAIPLWATITQSFRSNTFIGSALDGMFMPPWEWSFDAYTALLGNNGFLIAFRNSLTILVAGVATALILTIPMAYTLSVKTLPGRKFLNIMLIIPHVFSVGLIPMYLVVIKTGVYGTIASIFLPAAISTYNCIIMKQFFEGIPGELKESAFIDGCSDMQILLRIILPLSKAIVMTIGLYYGVSFWNDFFHAMIYNAPTPLPILLRNILIGSGMNEYVEVSAFGNAPIEAIKAASVFLAAIPMIIAYPFIQKYFTKGTLLGSVKG